MFNIHALYRQIFKIWRMRRFDLFLRLLRPRPSDTVLDVGGFPGFWTAHPHPIDRIDTLNLEAVPSVSPDASKQRIRTMVGDGCALGFADDSYEIGFSNSVIEHVGSWERQQQFAAELRRVANRLWVQTPAYECPYEPHYMTPLIHYLPPGLQKRILRWASVWGWIARPSEAEIGSMVDSTRLLRKCEMRRLFPDCEIITERILWIFPKSYIAIRGAL